MSDIRRDDKPARLPRPVRKLSKRLDVARQLHDLEQDAALDIVDIERLRVSVTRSLWLFLAVGSVFTTTGVQDFLAGHLTPADPVWWGCWGVEPCLVGILITVLRWEAAMIARDIDIDSKAVDWLKRFLLGSTLVMNVVPALWPREGGIRAGMLAAHIMVPVLVFFLAEVMPIVQARCTQARRAITLPTNAPAPAPAPVTMPAVVAEPAAPAPPPPAPPPAPAPEPVTVPPSVPVRLVEETPASDAAAEPPALALDGLGIPTGMQAQIRRLVADLDRPVTAADIQQATRLPLSIASKVADRLAPVAVNGYAH
ncbi:hypothetical protein ACFY2R_10440 [Micromonospora olivasterospora]|uniref:DUF2637 domain-containing protein n=1 Tax=Micromonospora olivasterospora TaxID=1880 RepID=A0A562I9X0_MICOL|nr:hypothetical protein [Micromonospora olivasterospora]TWH67493.1 hypothetical protein JD77_02470 [Micromonospora olivasterospora]